MTTSARRVNHGKPVPLSEFAAGISPTRRERILRWTSRDSVAEEKVVVDSSSQQQQQQRRLCLSSSAAANCNRSSPRASPTLTSSSTSLQHQGRVAAGKPLLVYMASPLGLQSPPAARQESPSPLRRGESVRRRRSRVSVDFDSDSLDFSSRRESNNNNRVQQEPPSTSEPTTSVPTFEEILNQRVTTSTSTADLEAVPSNTSHCIPQGYPEAVGNGITGPNDSLISMNSGRSNPGQDGDLDMGSSMKRVPVDKGPDDFPTFQNSTELKQVPETSAGHEDSADDRMHKLRSSKITDAATEESYSTRTVDDLKNQPVEGLSAMESTPVSSSSDGTGKGHESSTKHFDFGASNSSLENHHSEGSARTSVNGTSGQKIQRKMNSYSSGFNQEEYESLSHGHGQSAAHNTWQCIPDFTPGNPSPRIRNHRGAAAGSKIPLSFRKALDSSRARFRGLPIPCRGLSIAENVLDNSRSKLGSFGCGPPPFRPAAADSHSDLQRITRAESTTLQQLFVSTTAPSSASPVKSLRKWMTDQFQLGGGSKKWKDGLALTTTSDSPQSDQNVQEQHDLIENHLRRVSARNRDNPLGELRTSQNGTRTQDRNGEQFMDKHFNEDSEVQPRRRHHHHERKMEGSNSRSAGSQHPSAKSAHLMITHSGPLKFEGLQHLFGADSCNSSSQWRQNVSQTDSEGETLRAIKFLECSEVEKLNEFLRAKRDSVASCRTNGSGYLKFISTSHPIDLGSMICAICYSYYLEKRRKGPGRWSVVPLMNFSRWRMIQNLDAAWLFDACGLDGEALLFASEVDIQGLSRDGVTTRTLFVGDQVLRKSDEIGSCCTLLAETFSRDADELWARSGSILKTLLLAGLLMDTENLRKATSSATSTRDHRMLLHLLTGSACLDRLVLYERMKAVYRDARVLSRVRNYYGTAIEGQCTNASESPGSFPLRPPASGRLTMSRSKNLVSSKGSPVFSCSEADDYSRSLESPTSLSSTWVRSLSSSSPDTVEPHPSKPAFQNFSSLGKSPGGTLMEELLVSYKKLVTS